MSTFERLEKITLKSKQVLLNMKICWAKMYDVNFDISFSYNGESKQEVNVRPYI